MTKWDIRPAETDTGGTNVLGKRGESMESGVVETALALRARLHGLAERSGEERRTKAALLTFLRERTGLELTDNGAWFCALHREPGAKETVALRADMDAVPGPEGPEHLCGHDGHSAALAGLGLWLEGKRLGRSVLLIFQHAEETGAGGPVCARALEGYGARRAYAFHNIPGRPLGEVVLRRGSFACASRGMTLVLEGAPAHAAYPEQGRNPGFAAGRFLAALPELTAALPRRGLAMVTLIGAQLGQKAFGSAAGRAEVWLTLRAEEDGDLALLAGALERSARAQAQADGLGLTVSFCDEFPATVNHPDAQQRLEAACVRAGLACGQAPQPFRWSEDFGHYGAAAPSAMAGIGAGEDWPGLHTRDYGFNDRVLPYALDFFAALAQWG